MPWRASLIEDNRDKVEAMTKALLEWETIDAEQIGDIMAARPPRPPKPSQSTAEPACGWRQADAHRQRRPRIRRRKPEQR